jgi:hypothetical protein
VPKRRRPWFNALLQRRVIVTIQMAARELSLSEPTIGAELGHVTSLSVAGGVVFPREDTGLSAGFRRPPKAGNRRRTD